VDERVANVGAVVGQRRSGQAQSGRTEARRSVEQRCPALGSGREERALEQLPRHSEAEFPLELAARRDQSGKAGLRGAGPGRLEQARLADSGRALDREHAAVAGQRSGQ
jgi:hypothetical protein